MCVVQDLQKLLDTIVAEYEVSTASLEPTEAFKITDDLNKKTGDFVTIA